MTSIVILVIGTSCLWLGSLVASTWLVVVLGRIRWSAALLVAYPLWWCCQLLITKGLSLFHEINQRSLIIATSLLFAIPVIFAIVLNRNKRDSQHPASEGKGSEQFGSRWSGAHHLKAAVRTYWLEGVAIIYVGLVTVDAALLYAPQVADGFNYHLPMIANWLQQGSLAPWTTACLKQITRVGGGEYQQLWVIGMPHVDLLVELPSILAGVIIGFFVWEMAQRWGASRPVALAAGFSVFAIPQIFWTALSCKDDLIMSAGIVCALFNAIASFSETRRRLASFQAGVAAISAALVCATKIPGLAFGGSFILLFGLSLMKMGMWKRFWLVTAVFVLSSVPLFVLQYIYNFHRFGILFAETYVGAVAGDEPNPRTARNVLGSSVYYLLKLLFFEPARGVGPNQDRSNYGMWFSLIVLPLFAVTNWKSLVALLKAKQENRTKFLRTERLFVVSYILLAIATILTRRTFSTWDQRFLIWICPLMLLLSVHAVEDYISPIFFRILCVVFTITSVRAVLATAYPAASGLSLSGTIETQPNPRYLAGYEAISNAEPGDTVLYVGGEDTAESPCWGWKYDRTVWAADTPITLRKYFERSPTWVVLEEAASEDLRSATLESLSARLYRQVSPDAASQSERPLHERRTIWRR
jgi:hypothetical protein